MRSTLSRTLRTAALAATLALPLATAPTLLPAPAMAQTMLPPPYLSYALDAVLLPIDDSVRSTFGLAAGDTGVFVLATAPGGLADAAGVLPGDVLGFVQGEEILSPEDLDLIIWAWLQQGITDYTFDGNRAGASLAVTTLITVELWEETVEITEISSWSSYSSESFSYEEYTAEYSEEITTTYEEQSFESTEEEVSEEVLTEEEATEDVATEEEVTDEAAAEDGTEDEACPGEIVDGVCTDGAEEAVDDGAIDEGGDEGGEEEIVE